MTEEYGLEYHFAQDVDYQSELVKLTIADMLSSRLAELGLSRKELASRLGLSPSRVSQILAGYSNLTIETLVGVAMALDTKVYVELVPDQQNQMPGPTESNTHPRTTDRSSAPPDAQLALAA